MNNVSYKRNISYFDTGYCLTNKINGDQKTKNGGGDRRRRGVIGDFCETLRFWSVFEGYLNSKSILINQTLSSCTNFHFIFYTLISFSAAHN